MKLTLTEGEVKRAIQHYLETRTKGTKWQDFNVTLHWRGKRPYAMVEVLRPIPTLSERVNEPPQ